MVCRSVGRLVGWSVTLELKSGKTHISAPAHPSATDGRVSGLVLQYVKKSKTDTDFFPDHRDHRICHRGYDLCRCRDLSHYCNRPFIARPFIGKQVTWGGQGRSTLVHTPILTPNTQTYACFFHFSTQSSPTDKWTDQRTDRQSLFIELRVCN